MYSLDRPADNRRGEVKRRREGGTKAELDDLECMRQELRAVKTKTQPDVLLMAIAALEPSEPWRETLLIICILAFVIIITQLF
jgi:hypothetical protein